MTQQLPPALVERAECVCGLTPCTGLDCGPWLPGRAPRKQPVPKTGVELKTIRAKAWATRRGRALQKEQGL